MGFRCTFMDNDMYSASEVNNAFSHLLGAGVALFNDTGNALTDLNDEMAQLVSEGALLGNDTCRVNKSGDIYKILSGTCIMPDGSQITFDKDGFEITPLENVTSYVYLKRNNEANRIDIVVSDMQGTEGSVPLAEISPGGKVKDTRRFAEAKVALASANITVVRQITLNLNEYNPTDEIDMGFTGYKYFNCPEYFGPGGDGNYVFSDLLSGHTIYVAMNVTVEKSGSRLVFRLIPGTGHYQGTLTLRVR